MMIFRYVLVYFSISMEGHKFSISGPTVRMY